MADSLQASRKRKASWLLALSTACSYAVAVVCSILLKDAGNHIFGLPACMLYVFLGLLAVGVAGTIALALGFALLRMERNSQQPSLAAPLLSQQAGVSTAIPGGLGMSVEGTEMAPQHDESIDSVSELDTSSSSSLSSLDLEKAKRLAKMDHAVTVRRHAVFVAAYVSITALSFGLGIEAVDLREKDAVAPMGLEIAYVAAAIAALQAAFFATKQLVAILLAVPGITLELRNVHVHPLQLCVETADHSCDICGEEIVGEDAFMCKICDFDYCLSCFKKGKKLQDWGLLRGDKGVKVPESARQMGMVTFFFRAIGLLRAYKLHVIVTAACLFINVVCRLFVPNVEGALFDNLIHQRMDPFIRQVQFLATYWVGQTIFQSVQRLVSRLMARQLRLDLRARLFDRLLAQDIAFFDATRTGAMSNRIDGDVEDMSRPVPLIINKVIQSVVLIVGALVCCLAASPRLTVLSAACMGPIAYLTRVSSNWGSSLNNQMCACEEEGNSVVQEAMSNIRHVRAFSGEQYESGRYRRVIKRLARKMRKEAFGDLVLENLENTLEFLVEMLVLLFGGLAIVQGHQDALSVGQLISFTLYWDMLRDGLDSVQEVFGDLAQAAGAAQRVFDLLDISPDIPLETGQELSRDTFRGCVEFDNVHFRYQARPDAPVLKGLSLKIPASGTCALVGRSGAGKSTLMHLLLRFYDPQEGQIKVDDVPLTALNLRKVHDLTGFVAQDTKLSYGTIRDNSTYGLPWGDPEEGELEAACTAANCTEFIAEMEDSYDSKVGEGGIRLSGGQRQRLAIARAFLRRPRLLILDEATSHLDAENEQKVQAAIDNLVEGSRTSSSSSSSTGPKGCTVILIAHRLSTVRSADIIAVINDGVVVEQGTHDALVQIDGGLYAQLVAKQAERAANALPEDGGIPRDANVDKLFAKVLGEDDRGSSGGSGSGSGSGSSGSGSGSDESGSSSSSSSSSNHKPVGRRAGRPKREEAPGPGNAPGEKSDTKSTARETDKKKASRDEKRAGANGKVIHTAGDDSLEESNGEEDDDEEEREDEQSDETKNVNTNGKQKKGIMPKAKGKTRPKFKMRKR